MTRKDWQQQKKKYIQDKDILSLNNGFTVNFDNIAYIDEPLIDVNKDTPVYIVRIALNSGKYHNIEFKLRKEYKYIKKWYGMSKKAYTAQDYFNNPITIEHQEKQYKIAIERFKKYLTAKTRKYYDT
jgi:hypothetical protein